MSRKNTVLSALHASVILLLLISAALVETAIAQVPIRIGPATTSRPGSKPQQEPCWEVAGVSKSAMQQRRAISQRARQGVEGVCANSALSIQQKRQEIQQIRQRERQEIEAITTPAQQEAMRSCQEQRHPVASGGGHAVGGGPCGEMPVGHKPNPQPEEDEMPPNDATHPN
jgi:hypothetical protein